MWLWILWCNCHRVHVAMMLFLASKIGFHGFVVLFHAVLPLRLWKQLSCFLSVEFVSMACQKSYCQIEMLSLHLPSGKSCLGCWAVRLHFLVLTTLRRMGWLSDSIAPLSRYYDATVQVHKNSGISCLLSVSSLWTPPSKQLYRTSHSGLFMASCQLYPLMYNWLLCSFLLCRTSWQHEGRSNSVF